MTAHQSYIPFAQAFREIAALRHVGDEEISVAKLLANIPYRHLAADETAGMDHRPQRRIDQAERQCVLGMGMHDRHHVGPRLEYRRVDEALEIGLTFVFDRLALLIELDQIVAFD